MAGAEAGRHRAVAPDRRAWLREPVLHFLGAGLLLFAVDRWLPDAPAAPGAETAGITVTAADIDWLAGIWLAQKGTAPEAFEMEGLVSAFIRETAMAREAMALGLDRDDVVVRRRLAQKLEFLVNDTMRLAEPAEADLRAWHQRHAARYTDPGRVSFVQLFFSPTRRADAAADAAAALERLHPASFPDDGIGDATLLDPAFRDADLTMVAARFGDGFAAALAEAPRGPGTARSPRPSGCTSCGSMRRRRGRCVPSRRSATRSLPTGGGRRSAS